MKKNIGQSDRMFRMILSIVIAFAGYYYKSWWGLLALVPLVTAFIGYCPLYSLLGMNSCEKK